MPEGRPRRASRPLLAAGLGTILLGAAGIAHFTVHAAIAGFPPAVLGMPVNWLFIGGHALLGALGLALVGLAASRRERPRAPSPEEGERA